MKLLVDLEEGGLFTTHLQSSKLIFRYHHLFEEALQAELFRQYSAQEIQSIAKKAAQLIYMQGDYTSAIELAFKYNLYEQAQIWITKHLYISVYQGKPRLPCVGCSSFKASNIRFLILGYENAISTFDMAIATLLLQELEQLQQTENWMVQEKIPAMVNIYERIKANELNAIGGDLNTVKEILRKQLTRHHVHSILVDYQCPIIVLNINYYEQI